jgi:hypothetical protein
VPVRRPELILGPLPQHLQLPGLGLDRQSLPLPLPPQRLGRLPGLPQHRASVLLGPGAQDRGRLPGLASSLARSAWASVRV